MGRRNRYSNDYEVHETLKEGSKKEKYEKKLVYTGAYYGYGENISSITRVKMTYLILMLVITAAYVAIGMLNSMGTRKLYIVLPYVIMFLPIFYGIMGSIKHWFSKERMTRIEHDQSIVRIKKSVTSLITLSIACCIGEAVYLFTKEGSEQMKLEGMFVSGIVVIGILAFMLLQLTKKYPIQEV